MAYDPNRVHSDVASCLDEIARAIKGEEVRGSIYDAIELIDARSVQLETDVRATMQTTANETMAAYCPQFILYEEEHVGVCNIGANVLYRAISEKTPIIPYIYISMTPSTAEQNIFNNRIYSITSHVSQIKNRPIINSYEVNSDASELICYTITFDSSISNTVTWTKTTVPISGGGGGSYTEGDGIDITNNEISVNLKRFLGINVSMLDTDNLGGLYVDIDKLVIGLEMKDTFQKKLTSANAGTGISIANDAQGNPVISLDLPQAEGGGF